MNLTSIYSITFEKFYFNILTLMLFVLEWNISLAQQIVKLKPFIGYRRSLISLAVQQAVFYCTRLTTRLVIFSIAPKHQLTSFLFSTTVIRNLQDLDFELD